MVGYSAARRSHTAAAYLSPSPKRLPSPVQRHVGVHPQRALLHAAAARAQPLHDQHQLLHQRRRLLAILEKRGKRVWLGINFWV